jgi:autotransporter-associated beta strand protein
LTYGQELSATASGSSTPVYWAFPASGNWSNSANWTSLPVPSAVFAWAVLNAATTAALNVTLDEPVTLGTLEFGNSASVGYTVSGAGSNTLTMNNAGLGASILVDNGSHVVNAPVILFDNLTVSGSGTLTFSASSSITDGGQGFGLTMNGPGLLVLLGSNSYSGATTIGGGTLQLGDGTTGHDPSLTTSGMTNNAALVYNVGVSQTASYAISGSGSLIKTGPGTLVLSGTNTFTGGLYVEDGTAVLDDPAALVDGSSLIVGQGAAQIFGTVLPAAVSSSGAAVPEPATLALLAAGLLAAIGVRRRKGQCA